MIKLITVIAGLYFLLGCSANNQNQNEAPITRALAKFEPPEGKVLVFIGQDNESVGGTQKWSNGYIDNVGMPAGITHYVYMTENKENNFGFTLHGNIIDGLEAETTWGSGPMCLTCYLESPNLDKSIIHLSISMEYGAEKSIALGQADHLLSQLSTYIAKYDKHPFLIRIGYEFEGKWNDYNAAYFVLAWRRIVDSLRDNGVDNFATVFASSTYALPREKWEEYWPGDDYVDWIGYSYWTNKSASPIALEFAQEKGKPVFIAETTPRGFWLDKASGNLIWSDWYAQLFDHIERYPDLIKAVSYINTHWDAVPMWTGWGDTRIELNEELKAKWLEKMSDENYIHGTSQKTVHGTENTFDLIRFKPNK